MNNYWILRLKQKVIIISDSKYKDELESEVHSHIQSINNNLTEAERIYNDYELQYKTDRFVDYFKNNYYNLIPQYITLLNYTIAMQIFYI